MKPMKIYEDTQNLYNKIYKIRAAGPFEKRVNSNRTTLKVHGVRGRHNQCLINFANIFDFENLCKSIGNSAYSLKPIKTMEINAKQ